MWRSHFGDPLGDSFSYDFSGKEILPKRPQLSDALAIRTITPSSWPRGGGVVGNRAGCHIWVHMSRICFWIRYSDSLYRMLKFSWDSDWYFHMHCSFHLNHRFACQWNDLGVKSHICGLQLGKSGTYRQEILDISDGQIHYRAPYLSKILCIYFGKLLGQDDFTSILCKIWFRITILIE